MRSGGARSMQITARRRRTVIFTLAAVIAIVVAFIGGCTSDDNGNAGAGAGFTHVSTEPCPDSRFECVTLAVPRDHFSADATTWEVTFGIQRAAVEAKGTFVTITGGPGTSGLVLADGYTDVDRRRRPTDRDRARRTGNFDIVFLDQRGIGASHPLRCDEAAAAPSTCSTTTSREHEPTTMR